MKMTATTEDNLKDERDYNYLVSDGILVVYSENEGICYYGSINEEDEVEDTINELYEEGILCINSIVEEKRTYNIVEVFKKLNLVNKML